MERLIETEILRQEEILNRGEKVIQQTLSFDVQTSQIKVLREKSDVHDYRYFPDPDLLPLIFNQSLVDTIKEKLPELPDAKKKRFILDYALPGYDADFLTSSISLANYFEESVKYFRGPEAKKVSNWIMVELHKLLNEFSLPIEKSPVPASEMSELLNLIHEGEISGKMAKDVFQKMFDERKKHAALLKNLVLSKLTMSRKSPC